MREITTAVLQVDGVNCERWARIKTAAAERSVHMFGDHGTAAIHGVVVAYNYSGDQLTVSILHVPTFLGHELITESDAEEKIRVWLQGIA